MNYAATAKRAQAAIAKFGQVATFRRKTATTEPALTVTIDATAKTATRSSGSWLDDGFVNAMTVTFGSFANSANNAAFLVSGISATMLTFATATTLVDETATGVTAEATTDYSCSALEMDVNSIALYTQSLVPGSGINESTRFFLVANSIEPRPTDQFIIGGKTLIMDGIRPLQPGGIPIMYTVRARA